MAARTSASKSLGTVLVVGGCGFLGSHVVDQLLNFPSEDSIAASTANGTTDGNAEGRPIDRMEAWKHLSTSPRQDPAEYAFPTLRSRYPSYENTSVHVLDLRCAHNRLHGATYHEGDITDPSALLTVFRNVKPDVVINTASPTIYAPVPVMRKVNIEGTKALIEVAGGVHGDWGGNCKAFVHTSSSSVVSNTRDDLINVDERWPLVVSNPKEPYSETKALAEIFVLDSNGKHKNMLTCCVRPAGIVGEKDKGSWCHAILTAASNSPLWQLHVRLGSGDNLFDNTYVGNVVYAHLLAAERLLDTYKRLENGQPAPLDHEKVDGEAFNVTNDEPAYFWDSVTFVWVLYGRKIDPSKIWRIPKELAFVMGGLAELSSMITGKQTKMTRQSVRYSCMTRYCSCEKLKRRVGYQPIVRVEEGLKRAAKSFVVDQRAESAEGGIEKKAQ